MRKTLERNTGALITVVIEDTPAFRANLLPGDIIIAIDSLDIVSPVQMVESLPLFAGRTVIVKVLRNGKERELSVALRKEG